MLAFAEQGDDPEKHHRPEYAQIAQYERGDDASCHDYLGYGRHQSPYAVGHEHRTMAFPVEFVHDVTDVVPMCVSAFSHFPAAKILNDTTGCPAMSVEIGKNGRRFSNTSNARFVYPPYLCIAIDDKGRYGLAVPLNTKIISYENTTSDNACCPGIWKCHGIGT